MMEILQIITAVTASCGFAVIFQIKLHHMKYIAIGGMLSWGSYFMVLKLFGDPMKAMFIASAAVTLYSELCARIGKVPSTLIYVPAIIPLIPGSYLYYCTNGLVAGNEEEFRKYTELLIENALAIVLGTVLVYTVISLFTGKYEKRFGVR